MNKKEKIKIIGVCIESKSNVTDIPGEKTKNGGQKICRIAVVSLPCELKYSPRNIHYFCLFED